MRLTLDTNVWSYVAIRNEVDGLEELEEAQQLTLAIPPSTLLEALRTPNSSVREQIVRGMTRRPRARVHLRSEARLEADELVAEIDRLRPAWKRRFPDVGSLRRLDEFWTRRVYQIAQDRPDSLAAIEKTLEVDEYLQSLQRETQERARASDFDITAAEPWAHLDPDSPVEQRLGWESGRVMAWRAQNANLWWTQLAIVPRRRMIRAGAQVRFDTTS